MIEIRPEGYSSLNPVVPRPQSAAGGDKIRKNGADYDRVMLTETSDEKHILRELTAKLSYQVRTENTTGKVKELCRQVKAGEYKPDAAETARRMLLIGEDD